jgi:hypothetical protein
LFTVLKTGLSQGCEVSMDFKLLPELAAEIVIRIFSPSGAEDQAGAPHRAERLSEQRQTTALAKVTLGCELRRVNAVRAQRIWL